MKDKEKSWWHAVDSFMSDVVLTHSGKAVDSFSLVSSQDSISRVLKEWIE